jgi:integrase
MAGLTGQAIEQAKAGAARREIADGKCAGLYLVVQPGGAKSWALRFRSPVERDKQGQRKAKKLTLGTLAVGASKATPEIGQPLTLGQARVLATTAMETVRQGLDPSATRREEKAKVREHAVADNSIDAAMIEFLKRYKGKKKQGIRESTRLLTATYLGLKPDPDKPGQWKKTGRGVLGQWSGKPLASIVKRDAISLLNKLVDAGHGVTANRTLTVLKTFFGWCIKNDLLTISPVAVLDAVAKESERERILTGAELAAAWKVADVDCDSRRKDAVKGYPFGRLVQFVILTGARRDEMREAPWSEFELELASVALPNGAHWKGPLWTLPAIRAKNNNRHLVPLSPSAVDILGNLPNIHGGGLLFTLTGTTPISGLSRAKRRLDAAMLAEMRKHDPDYVMQPWTIHDLRRTFYSGLQALGFSMEVADACVNHRGAIRGASKHYAWYEYLPEKTAAFEAWARHVDGLVNGVAGADVVPLHGVTR